MKLNLSKFLPDRDLANNGIWQELYPGVHFLIAYAGSANKAFKAATMKMALRAGIRETEVEKLTPEQLEKLAIENIPIYAECIVKDWKGVIDEDTDQAVLYSPKTAENLLTNYPEVFDRVSVISKNEKLYKVPTEANKEAIKKK